jgi:FtsH-binding integral membrane protein
MGVSLSTLFLAFSGILIAKTFFITASMFGSISIYGYTTKKDLSGYGHILMMIVFGLLIASIVNLFTQSSGLQFGISCISVIVFSLLVAYDTQNLKQMYYSVCHDQNLATRVGIFGALQLYIDFVAIFVHLLQVFANSNRKN